MSKLNSEKEPHVQSGRSSRRDERVEEASQESFPASDPPAYTPSRSGGVDREVHLGTGADGVAETQELHDQVKHWAHRFCAALSGKGNEGLDALLAEDVAWRAGDGPLMVGPAAVAEWQRSHFDTWGRVACRMIDARGDEHALFIESEVRRGGSDAPNHEAMSIKLRGDRAVRVQLYGAVYDAPQAGDSPASATASPSPAA